MSIIPHQLLNTSMKEFICTSQWLRRRASLVLQLERISAVAGFDNFSHHLIYQVCRVQLEVRLVDWDPCLYHFQLQV